MQGKKHKLKNTKKQKKRFTLPDKYSFALRIMDKIDKITLQFDLSGTNFNGDTSTGVKQIEGLTDDSDAKQAYFF